MLSRLGARLAGLCGLMLMIGVSACRKDPLEVIKDRKSTRLNSSHSQISYAVFCLKKKNAFLQSKLALVMFTFDLTPALHGPGVTVHSLHPASSMNHVMVREGGTFAYVILVECGSA